MSSLFKGTQVQRKEGGGWIAHLDLQPRSFCLQHPSQHAVLFYFTIVSKRLKRKNVDNDKGENQTINIKSKASIILGKCNRAVSANSWASGGQLAFECWVCVSLALLIFNPCDQVTEGRLLSKHSTKRSKASLLSLRVQAGELVWVC